jgi:hypothetical protein
MDFLPLPDDLSEHALVPELPGVPYDNQGFSGYDVRQGWNLKLLREGNIRGARSEWNEYSQASLAEYGDDVHEFSGEQLVQFLVAPFIQNWIIYGLFHEALGHHISRDEATFTRTNERGETRRYLTLKSLFGELSARKEELAHDAKWHQEFPAFLDEATWILGDLDALHDGLGAPVIPGPTAVTLSALVRTLHDYAIIWFYPQITDSGGHSRLRWLEYKLEDEGWCPERIKRLLVELGPEGLYYASLLDVTDDGKSHDECSESTCVAYNMKNHDEYRQRHDSRYCLCKDEMCTHNVDSCRCRVTYDIESLTDKIRTSVIHGRIPLLIARHSFYGTELEVKDSEEEQDYIAISHVWSDGMGNPRQNAIPPCLICSLDFCVQKMFEKLKPGKEPKFWLDTICVPLSPREARDSAIENMRRVYADASSVLVITQDLISRPLPKTFQETIVRICQSKWFKRLWTMQEGVLAKSLAFQFENHAIDYEFLDDRLHLEIHATTDTSALVGSRANLMVSNLITMQGINKSREDLFDSLWLNVRHRATSRPSDQAVCASILCGLDLRPVLAADNEDKMRVFWKTCRDIPLGVFWANGPRFDFETMRWAPKSLLHPSTWAMPPPKTGLIARVLDDGLHFSGVNAFYLQSVELPSLEDSMIEFQAQEDPTTYVILLTKKVDNPSWTSLGQFWKSVCILLYKLPELVGFSQGVLVSCSTVDDQELCAEPSEMQQDVLRARWLAQVNLFVKGGEWTEFITSFPTRYGEDGDPLPRQMVDVTVYPSRARKILKEREWCIF